MEIVTDLKQIHMEDPSVVVLGKFDGVHQGHQKLLLKAKELAAEKNLKTIVFTFCFPQKSRAFLTTACEKESLLRAIGIDYIMECPFGDICDMEAEAFLKEVILEKFHAEYMVVGTDCSFGRNRTGNAAMAASFMAANHKQAVIVDKVRYNDREISSTYVREAVAGGDIQLANTLLGRKYFFEGIVVAGNQIGRTLDFPTVNLIPEEEKVLPVFGVYASSVCMEGITYTGVTNIGVKPTIGSTQPCVETYLLDYEGNAYGKKIRVSLEYFVRPEMRFDSLAQLKEQVHKDICNVRTNHPQSII